MKNPPCENIIWNILPVIRKMIACCIIHEYGLSQKETAYKMGLTPAAICQYECDKRGREKISNEDLIKEIKISSQRIIKDGEKIVDTEICRICRLIKSNKIKII
jgi:predicted transcriptional regulator